MAAPIKAKHSTSGELVTISTKQRLAGLTFAAALVGGSAALVPAQGDAATALPCSAHMQDATPKQYTYDRVYVKTAPSAGIRTVAHYKTTSTTKYGKASGSGQGSTQYYISSATAGYRVWVDVYVHTANSSGHCRTSFVPHG